MTREGKAHKSLFYVNIGKTNYQHLTTLKLVQDVNVSIRKLPTCTTYKYLTIYYHNTY